MNEGVYKDYTRTSVHTGQDIEKFTAWSHRYFRSFILPHLPSGKTAHILEIGCGYGRYTGLLTNDLKYGNVTGVDISEEQIQYARDRYKLTNVFQMDALEYLKKNPGPYDAVILMDVLEHLELSYAIELLKQVHHSLKPSARLIIQVPNGLSPLKPIFYGDVTHVRPFSPASLSQILRMGGFSTFRHRALPPLVDGIKGLIQWLAWWIVINPAIYIFTVLSHGNAAGGIYSSNLLSIATK